MRLIQLHKDEILDKKEFKQLATLFLKKFAATIIKDFQGKINSVKTTSIKASAVINNTCIVQLLLEMAIL